jgi:hypothetical protein
MKLTLTQIMERIFQRFATMPMELLKILFQVSLAYINNVISAYIIWEKLFKASIWILSSSTSAAMSAAAS